MAKKTKEYSANQERIQKQKELLLEQLKKTPVIEIACQKIGVGRTTFYRWRTEDADFEKASNEALGNGIELINDLAESKLIGQIQEGNFPSIRFWLQNHHGKYKNKIEISSETKQELTKEQQEILSKAYQRLGLTNNTIEESYDKPSIGSGDNEPDSDKQNSET